MKVRVPVVQFDLWKLLDDVTVCAPLNAQAIVEYVNAHKNNDSFELIFDCEGDQFVTIKHIDSDGRTNWISDLHKQSLPTEIVTIIDEIGSRVIAL